MDAPQTRLPMDYPTVSELLSALAYPVRLELLDKLRTPRALRDIEVHPQKSQAGERAERTSSRQSVQWHLDKLKEAELLRVETLDDGGKATTLYVANPVQLYTAMEAIRNLIVRYAGPGLDADITATASGAARPERATGPRLTVVHGVYEGRSFPLRDDTSKGGSWPIGRAKGLPVCLDYDPFVSQETAVVSSDADGFVITDLGSKNGTTLNWSPLPPGEPRPLASGDVVGVGRSLLVFVAR